MNILFIKSILEQDWQRLQTLSLILAVFYLSVLVAVLIDLSSGVEKAKRHGKHRTSYGFRRTVMKIKDYFSVLMLFTIADIVASIWFSLPFFTAIGTIGLIVIEAKSVWENKRDVNKGIDELPEVLSGIIKNRDDLTELLRMMEENKKIETEKNKDNEDK